MARRNQVVVLTPFTLAGAMAPVTLAGALAQQHAEALAGLVVAQLARPGSPFVYGGFTSNVDMKSGAPAFGTPEYMKTAIVGGQLARRLGLPYRSSNANAANTLDAQAAYESVFSLWGAIMGGVNLLMHGAGWMEGGLAGLVREDGARRRSARDGRRVPAPAARRSRGTGDRGDARGRPRRAFLRRRAHPEPLPQRLLRADDFRLAQLRDLARGGLADRLRHGGAHLQAAARRLSVRRRSSRSGSRRWRPSSPAARPRAARRRISEATWRASLRQGRLSALPTAGSRHARRRRRFRRTPRSRSPFVAFGVGSGCGPAPPRR